MRLISFLSADGGNDESWDRIKKVLVDYLIWFLRERYVRIAMEKGKMVRKFDYLFQKNSYLLYLLTALAEVMNQEHICP